MNTQKTKVELFLSNEEVEFIDSMRSGQMTRAAIIGHHQGLNGRIKATIGDA